MALAGTGESRPPSTRPTLVPPLDLREAETGTMRAPGLPLDLLVPVDTGLRPTSLDHRAAVLLLQVDGHSTLAEIANAVGLPRAEVYAGFVALLRRGVVTLDTVASSTRREGR